MADFTMTTSPVNTKTWLSQNNLYVGGYTKIRVQCTPAQGSSFTSYYVSTVGGAYTGADVTTDTCPAWRSDTTIWVSVTASGPSGSVHHSVDLTILGYAKPSFTTFTAERGTYSNGTWTASPEGAHIRVEAVPTVSLTTQGNTATVTVKIGNTNPSATSGNYYYFTSTSASSSYTITGTATDKLLETTTRVLSVSTTEVPFNVDVDIPGAAFGKVTEKARAVDIAPSWSLNANGMHNTANVTPYSFRTTGGSATTGWARIARLTVTGTTSSGYAPRITFTVQATSNNAYAIIQLGFNGTVLAMPTVQPNGENWLCNPSVARSFPFVQTISRDTVNNIGVFDVYFPKGNAAEELTVYTECSAALQDRITIEYLEGLLDTKPSSNVIDFDLSPINRLTVSGSLVANGRNNTFAYMPYSFNAYGTSGTAGYLRIATITITGNNLSQPIEFDIQRRLDGKTVRLYVLFNNEGNTDPALSSFYYDSYAGTAGNKPEAFILKSATSVWEVYVRKSANSDNVGIYTLMPAHAQDRCNITYSQYQVSSIPSGATMATPVPPPSLGVGNPQMVRFNVANGSPKTITASSECALLISSTGWAQNIRSGLWFIAGYNDSSRADITTIKSASAISITGTSGLAWTITNTQSGTTADITVLVLWGAMPTVT